ncbi:uncharacterized protein [Dermacentor albipictus]|uniref:uncharacterized protein isoform X2 n=1 Tax=Dermacentor albipictus TaxID=60249 RepID=UPI0031FD71C6
MDDNPPCTIEADAEMSHRLHVELKRVPEPKARKALVSLKEEPPAAIAKRRGGTEAPAVAPSTRPPKPPKPLRRKLRPVARSEDVCEASSAARDRRNKPTVRTDAHLSTVVIQPWGSHDDAAPSNFCAINERTQVIDEDLCGSPAKECTFGSAEDMPRYAFPVERIPAVGVNAATKGAATTALKSRKVRPSNLPVRCVPLQERLLEPTRTTTKRVAASIMPTCVSSDENSVKKPAKNRIIVQCTADKMHLTDPDCGVSLPRFPAPDNGTTDGKPSKPQPFNTRRPRSRSSDCRVNDVGFMSSQYKLKENECHIFSPKVAGPSWSTTAEASNSLERDLENLVYDVNAEQGAEKIVTLACVDSSAKETPVSTVSDNSLLETTVSGDLTRASSNSQQLKKELLVFHAIILVAVTGAAALAIAFYPGAVKSSSGFPLLIERGFPVSVPPAPTVTSSNHPMDAPEQVVQREPLYDVCSTETCQKDGAYIGALISKDMDPCDDFYKFVCNRWKGLNGSTSPDDELVVKLESDIYHVLASPLPPSVQDSDVLSPLKRVMTACMNGANGTNVDPVLDLLAAADLEGFPFTPPVRSSISPWKTAAKVFLLTGTSALLRLGVALHPFEPDRDIITVEVPEPLIVGPEKTTTAYRRIMQASMNALGKRFVPSSYAMEVVAFTQQLDAAIASGESQRRDERLHRVVKLKDEIEHQMYLLEVLGDLQLPPDEGDRDVMLLSPNFSRTLVDLLRKTDVHVVLNFLCVHVLVRSSLFVSMSDPDLEWAVSAQLFNRPVRHVQRWRLCVRAAAKALPDLFLYASHQVVRTPDTMIRGVLDNVLKQLCLQEQAHVPESMSLSLLEDHTALKIIQELYQGNLHLASAAMASGGVRDVRLPGAEDFTADHLFFIYYALCFCTSGLREEQLEDEARLVNIPLRGSLMFHEVYGCRPTSKMGPLDKCTAWVAAAKQSAPMRS